MPQRIAGAVDARPLAVPEAEDAVEAPLAAQFRLLRAPQGGGREVLVDARIEDDARRLQHVGRAPELLVEAAQRRAAIAGDIAGRGQALAPVARLLHEEQAHHRLGPADQHPLLGEVVLVVKADGGKGHRALLPVPRRSGPAVIDADRTGKVNRTAPSAMISARIPARSTMFGVPTPGLGQARRFGACHRRPSVAGFRQGRSRSNRQGDAHGSFAAYQRCDRSRDRIHRTVGHLADPAVGPGQRRQRHVAQALRTVLERLAGTAVVSVRRPSICSPPPTRSSATSTSASTSSPNLLPKRSATGSTSSAMSSCCCLSLILMRQGGHALFVRSFAIGEMSSKTAA